MSQLQFPQYPSSTTSSIVQSISTKQTISIKSTKNSRKRNLTESTSTDKPITLSSEDITKLKKGASYIMLHEELRNWRRNKAKESKKKAYNVFTDKILEQLTLAQPNTSDELYLVEGFSVTRVTDFGDDITSICKKYGTFRAQFGKNKSSTFFKTATLEDKKKDKKNAKKQENIIESSALGKALRKYRLDKSHELSKKSFHIYTNKQLIDLINKCPTTIEELNDISGFGTQKVSLYGKDLIKLCKEHKNNDNNHKKTTKSGCCGVCSTKDNTHLCVPCGHKALCEGCSYKVSRCPTCNKLVTNIVKVQPD